MRGGVLVSMGDFPPPPPGYDPRTWPARQLPNGKWMLTDPGGRKCITHAEDDRHRRHWDIRNSDNSDGGRWPGGSLKRHGAQKKPLYGDQSDANLSGDAPGRSHPDGATSPDNLTIDPCIYAGAGPCADIP